MEKNPVLEYLYKELKVNESRLKKAIEKKQDLENEIKDLNQKQMVLKQTFDKALKDFGVDASDYKFTFFQPDEYEQIMSDNKPTIADAAFHLLNKYRYPMHISDISDILVTNNLISTRAEDPVPSVTSALARDKERFESLGRGMWILTEKFRDYGKEEEEEIDFDIPSEPDSSDDDIPF